MITKKQERRIIRLFSDLDRKYCGATARWAPRFGEELLRYAEVVDRLGGHGQEFEVDSVVQRKGYLGDGFTSIGLFHHGVITVNVPSGDFTELAPLLREFEPSKRFAITSAKGYVEGREEEGRELIWVSDPGWSDLRSVKNALTRKYWGVETSITGVELHLQNTGIDSNIWVVAEAFPNYKKQKGTVRLR